jgi:ATP-binding cassette subfamily B protein
MSSEMKKASRTPQSVGGVLVMAARDQWRMFLGLVVIIVLAMVFEAVPPLILERLVDHNLTNNIALRIWTLAWAYFGALVAQRAVTFGQAYFTAMIGQETLHKLRMSLSRKLRALPISYYDQTPAGDIMSRATSDVEAVNTLFTDGVISMVADTMRLVGVAVAMVVLSPRLSLVSALVVPLVIVITEFFRRNIRASERATRKAVGQINSTYQESLAGIRVIHTFGEEDTFSGVLAHNLRDFLEAVIRASKYNAYFAPSMNTLQGLLTVALILIGATLTGGATAVTIGVLVAYLRLVERLFNPLTNLSDELQTIQEAFAGVERINEVLRLAEEERPDWLDAPLQAAGVVEVQGLRFGYFEGRPVLKNINLQVPQGERLAIVGRTGAGKTSLLNLLAGVYAPWAGSITVDGVDPRSVRPEDRRRLLGVVSQAVYLMEGTVKQNITLGDPRITDEAVVSAATTVGLHDAILAMPKGYDTVLGPGGAKFSHGQEQLLSLARALVCEPAVLLLDEPTSGMDADTESRLFSAIREESRKRTTITISHRMSGVMDAERVIVISNGQIVQDGTPEQLAQEDGWYAMMRALENLG